MLKSDLFKTNRPISTLKFTEDHQCCLETSFIFRHPFKYHSHDKILDLHYNTPPCFHFAYLSLHHLWSFNFINHHYYINSTSCIINYFPYNPLTTHTFILNTYKLCIMIQSMYPSVYFVNCKTCHHTMYNINMHRTFPVN